MARYNRASPPMVMSFEVTAAKMLLALFAPATISPPERRIAG